MSLDILVNMRYLSNSLSWEVSYETNRGIVSIYVYQRRFCRFLWSRLRQRIRLHDQSGKSEQSESSGWRHRFLQGSLWWIQKQERLLSGRHSLSVRAWKKEQGKELLCKSVQIRLCACMPSQRDLNYHNYKPLISLIVFTAVTSAWPPIFFVYRPVVLISCFRICVSCISVQSHKHSHAFSEKSADYSSFRKQKRIRSCCANPFMIIFNRNSFCRQTVWIIN